jgi:hypothetical protein
LPVLDDLKRKYNEILVRHAKAAEIMNDNSKSVAASEKWVDNYKSIVRELEEYIKEIKVQGCEMTQDEILNGFEV